MQCARRMLLLSFLFVIAGWTSCGNSPAPAPQPPAPPPGPPNPPADRPEFDAERAFDSLEEQVGFGSRAPGTPGHDQAAAYIFQELSATARRAFEQEFEASTLFGGPYQFTNLVGLFGPEDAGRKLMLCAHWDTRPVADEDPNPANRSKPVPGASDGASGVAVLLEIAHAFKQAPPPVPVIMAFFDAEDSGKSSGPLPYYGFCLGSAHFVKHMPPEATPDEVILVDLVGGDNVHNARVGTRASLGGNDVFDLPIEVNSLRAAPELVDEVYSAAEALGHKAFQRRQGFAVVDDHSPFLDAGIDAVDIIEFDYPEWHTIDDTPDHCDPGSLQQVGDTLLEVVYSRGG
jgi:glutaminyl-peptide cyclotransferase